TGSTKSLTSSAEAVDSSTPGSMYGSSSFSDTRCPAFSTVNHERLLIFPTGSSPRCLSSRLEAVRTTEYPGCTHTEQPVEQAHQRNYDDNEDQNISGHLHQFLAGRSDDLAHLVDDLAQEHHNASNDPALASALGSCCSAHRSSLHTVLLIGSSILSNLMRRADRTRTCNRRFWRPLRYQLRHCPRLDRTQK